MKFYLAIAFAQLMATAYGFRVKEATTSSGTTETAATTEAAAPADDSCQKYNFDDIDGDYTYDYTWCDLGEGNTNSCSEQIYLDGNKTTSNCTYTNTYDEATGSVNTNHCNRTKCEGNNTNCEVCMISKVILQIFNEIQNYFEICSKS